jgi:LmbE family N-acetylglucosaminyl deacetylase
VTVFGGDPRGAALTGFARWQHERWGTGAEDTLATREAEERAAAGILGCVTAALPYLDAIYRGDQYLSDDALFGPVAPADMPLIAHIAADVRALLAPGGTLYVPMAAGNHVDHQLVYTVGRRIAARDVRVLAYEDCPYGLLGAALTERQAAVAGELGAPEVRPVGAALATRLAAIAAYQSQLPTIFRFFADWRAAITAAAQAIGGAAGPAERFWPLVQATAQD